MNGAVQSGLAFEGLNALYNQRDVTHAATYETALSGIRWCGTFSY